MLASSGLNVPPTPLAAVHPELGAVLDEIVKQFRNAWMNGAKSFDVALSPPWGSAWLLPIGNLPEEEVESQVVWELEQRLDSPLDDYIYAWHPIGDQAYAIVVRPELLAFWENAAESNGLQVGSLTLLAGLVDPKVERSADLMPLYRLWAERGGELATHEVAAFEEDFETELGVPDDEGPGGYKPEELADDDDADEALHAILGDEQAGAGASRKKRKGGGAWLAVTIIVALLLLSSASLFVLRNRVPFARVVVDGARDALVAVKASFTRHPADRTTVVEEAQGMEQQAAEEEAPPPMPSSGAVLNGMFEQADMTNVELHSIILQGGDLEVEVAGQPEDITAWTNAMTAVPGAAVGKVDEPVALAPGTVVRLSSSAGGEQPMTVNEFATLAHSLGIEDHGEHAYSATREALMRLFGVMSGERKRPFRLSIHRAPGDRYLLVMFP